MSSHTTEEHEELIKSVCMRAHLLKDHELDLGAAGAQGYWAGYLKWVLHKFDERKMCVISDLKVSYDGGTVSAPKAHVFQQTWPDAKVVVLPKLFVVVPTSGAVVSSASDGIQTAFSSVETLSLCDNVTVSVRLLERGGQMRPMGHHPFYRIVLPDPAAPGGKVQCLFMMEWATPLQTINDMGLTPDQLKAHAAAFIVRLNRLKDLHPTSLGQYLRIITDDDGASLSTDLVSQVRTAYAEMSLVG